MTNEDDHLKDELVLVSSFFSVKSIFGGGSKQNWILLVSERPFVFLLFIPLSSHHTCVEYKLFILVIEQANSY